MKKLAVCGVVMTLGLMSPTPASASNSFLEREMVDALDAVEAGTWTSKDLSLIRSDPEVAASVPDPTDPGEVAVESDDAVMPLAASMSGATIDATSATCGRWARVTLTKKSLLGSAIYKWAHYVQYCSTSTTITKWENRYDYLSYNSGIIYVRDLVVSAQGGVGTSSAWSHKQRALEYCVVRYGCYANVTPWSKIVVKPNGAYTYTYSVT